MPPLKVAVRLSTGVFFLAWVLGMPSAGLQPLHVRAWALVAYRVLVFLGFSCNFLALAFNGWKMPVFGYSGRITSERHCVGNNRSRLYWLCDILGGGNFRFSVGDIFIWLSILTWFAVPKGLFF